MKKIIILFGFLMMVGALAQPTGTCSTGITKFGTDGIFYGCVEGVWKRLSENTISSVSVPAILGVTHNVNGVVYVREIDNTVRALNNVGFTPISLVGHTHEVGKIIYDTTQKHFYQGVSGGLWHRIDNNDVVGEMYRIEVTLMPPHNGNGQPIQIPLNDIYIGSLILVPCSDTNTWATTWGEIHQFAEETAWSIFNTAGTQAGLSLPVDYRYDVVFSPNTPNCGFQRRYYKTLN